MIRTELTPIENDLMNEIIKPEIIDEKSKKHKKLTPQEVIDKEKEYQKEIDNPESKIIKKLNKEMNLMINKQQVNKELETIHQNGIEKFDMQDDNEKLDTTFEGEMGQIQDTKIELFRERNFNVKTDLTEKHCSILPRLKYMGKITKENDYNDFEDILNDLTDSFKIDRINLNRQSRKEFVEIGKSDNANAQGIGAMQKFANIFSGNRKE